MRVAMELAEPTYTSAGYVRVDKPDVVTVPAGGETEVTVTLNLTDNCKEYLDEYYTSGAIVNGFIELMPVSEADGVSLTIPFLTYYGAGTMQQPLTADITMMNIPSTPTTTPTPSASRRAARSSSSSAKSPSSTMKMTSPLCMSTILQIATLSAPTATASSTPST